MSYNCYHFSINLQYYLKLLVLRSDLLIVGHLYAIFNTTLANFPIYIENFNQSQVTTYINSMSRYRGSIVVDDAGCLEIKYTIVFTILLSRIHGLGKEQVQVVSIISSNIISSNT